MPFFDYFKVIAENNLISKNKWLILWIFAGLSGGGGTIFQTFNASAKEEARIKGIHEVAIGFQTTIANIVQEKPQKKIVIQHSCNKCEQSVFNHEKKLHGEHR